MRRHTLKQADRERIYAMRVARDVRDADHLRQLRIVTNANFFADQGAKLLAPEILMLETANAQLDSLVCDGLARFYCREKKPQRFGENAMHPLRGQLSPIFARADARIALTILRLVRKTQHYRFHHLRARPQA